MQNIGKVNNYNIHDYMSIVDLSDQRLMTVSHPPRWISVLNWLTLTIFFSFLAILFSPLAFFFSNPITHLMFKYLGLERDW
jgi:hypothetical protein